jgi:hypothetical protein
MCSAAASTGAAPRDLASCSARSRHAVCAASCSRPSFRRPSCRGPPPVISPPYSAGGRRPDTYQSSPSEGAIDYERKMDEEERDYRHWRRAQEQERRSQQWEQERARERDPRYEWLQ